MNYFIEKKVHREGPVVGYIQKLKLLHEEYTKNHEEL